MRALFSLAAAGALAAASPASGCRIEPADPAAIIHDSLPAPGIAAFVAEVDFEPGSLRPETLHGAGALARVRRVVQGSYRGTSVVVGRVGLWADCDRPAANGEAGIIVAKPVGYENGLLVVEPILVSRRNGYRLEDGHPLGGNGARQ